MHPFFRYGHGNASPSGHGPNSRKDSIPRNRSPSGSCDDDDYEQTPAPKSTSSTPPQCCVSPTDRSVVSRFGPATKSGPPTVPIIKVEDEVVLSPQGPTRGREKGRSNENRKRLGPNKNNIILETLQNELKGGK